MLPLKTLSASIALQHLGSITIKGQEVWVAIWDGQVDVCCLLRAGPTLHQMEYLGELILVAGIASASDPKA